MLLAGLATRSISLRSANGSDSSGPPSGSDVVDLATLPVEACAVDGRFGTADFEAERLDPFELDLGTRSLVEQAGHATAAPAAERRTDRT